MKKLQFFFVTLLIILTGCSGDQTRNAALLSPVIEDLPLETETFIPAEELMTAVPSLPAEAVPLTTTAGEDLNSAAETEKGPSGLEEAAVFINLPSLVWEDDFGTDEQIERWKSEFPLNDSGSRIVDGELVFESPDSEWRSAGLVDPTQEFLEKFGQSGSQAVLITFHYTGSSKFRFQASFRPEDEPDYLYEIGIMFDEFPQRFIQAPDENPAQEKMFGWLQVKENEDYLFLMGIDQEKQEFMAAIWQPGDMQNSLVYYTPLREGLADEPWKLVLFTYKDTRISLDRVQILTFGE